MRLSNAWDLRGKNNFLGIVTHIPFNETEKD